MPRRQRRSKRRQPASDGWIIWACDGPIPDDSPENAEARSQWLDLEYFSTPEETAAMWRDHGDRAIEAWEGEYGKGSRSRRFAASSPPADNPDFMNFER